ncbi:MAG: CapA family protein [Actinobacteria bacterium]|nr:CapA family protein [Actinomycetota bacterium]
MVDGADRPRVSLWWAAPVFLCALAGSLALRVTTPDVNQHGLSLVPAGVDAAASAPTFTIEVSGEILPHPSIVERARQYGAVTGVPYDFAPIFADIAPAVSAADLSICHLEVPVAPAGSALGGYPEFGIPAEIGAGIASAGWNRCSTVSNHTMDRGAAGIAATLDALDAAEVAHSGTARSEAEASTLPIVDVDGVHVAHLAYTWGFNGVSPPQSWMANVIDTGRILTDAHASRAAGADIVVVSVHWGNEYDSSGSADQRMLADQLLASADIDLLVGHGPHVLQPIEMFHGKYALLSLGNLVANQGSDHPSTYDGVVASVSFSRGEGGTFVSAAPVVKPTWYDAGAGRVRLVASALADPTLVGIHDALTGSWMRTSALLAPYVVSTP